MEVKLGCASVVITPEKPKGLALGGYGNREKYCEGVHDDLYARIQYFKWQNDSEGQLLLISLDLIGINSNVLEFFIQRISERFTLPFSNIIISCTHTHSGFESLGVLGPGRLGFTGIFKSRLDTRVLFKIFLKIEDGISKAMKSTLPVIFGYRSLQLDTIIAVNRRKPKKIASPEINIMKFTNYHGDLISVVINTPIHATILGGNNYLMSADWIGQFITKLGNLLSGRNSSKQNETTVFINFFNGAQGNIVPFASSFLDISKEHNLEKAQTIVKLSAKSSKSQFPMTQFERIKKYGDYLAEKIQNHISKIECTEVESIQLKEKQFLIPIFGLPRSNKIKDLLSFLKDMTIKIVLLNLLKSSHAVVNPFLNLTKKNGREYIKSRLTGVKFGDILLLTSPGEMFYEIGREICDSIGENQDHQEENTIILGLANDYMSYLFPLSSYFEGGYEPVFQFAPKAGIIVKEALKEIGIELIKQ